MNLFSLHPSLNRKTHPHVSYYFLLVHIQIPCLCMLRLHFNTQQHFDHITMTLQLNNGHIIYCTWTQHSQWFWCRLVSLILTIWSYKVGSESLIHFLIQLIRQSYMFAIMLSSLWGWDTLPWAYPMTVSWLQEIILILCVP